MSDWKFDHNEVLVDDEGYWWHVRHRFVCEDTGTRLYYLEDGTHTGDQHVSAQYAEDDRRERFRSIGWRTDTKPAFEHGLRVNGMLTEPRNVPIWFGNACRSSYRCPSCGEHTTGDADVIVSYESREVGHVTVRCRACDTTAEVDL